MRKLKLDAEDLLVDTFDTVAARDGEEGTVHANSVASIDYACTRDESCYWELCQEQPTNDPRQKLCYTPYLECNTRGWTCDYCGG
jgi:hypothetical protein